MGFPIACEHMLPMAQLPVIDNRVLHVRSPLFVVLHTVLGLPVVGSTLPDSTVVLPLVTGLQ
jgi:hypothetical protein